MSSPRHLKSLLDLEPGDLAAILTRAEEMKRLRGTPEHGRPLEGKSVAILLEKASTRTRVSFEVGIHELGALPVTLIAKDTQLGRGEPLSDTARMFSGYVHAVVYRTFGHERIEELAADSRIPVINGLSALYHPCQLLADLLTLKQEFGELDGLSVAWVGDGNNMAHSWMLAAGLTGLDLRLACPEGYQPEPSVLAQAEALGRGSITITTDPQQACEGVDVVTTDVWASMGQEEEAKKRMQAFAGYEVDDALMARAAERAIFLHCLPAHRGEEVAASVIDGERSRVWREAENRLHAQKALLEWLLRES
jgi:ornithine carbamoyltransferase